MARIKDYLVIIIIAAVVFTYLILGDVVCSRSYIIADRSTGVYHMPNCSVLNDANPSNFISFKESIYNSNNYHDAAEKAQNAGYAPCSQCNPPMPAAPAQ